MKSAIPVFHDDPDPLDIEILVVPDAALILVAAVIEPLRAANRILGRRQYRWSISTPSGAAAMTASGIPIPADRAFDPAAAAAPLFVVASYRADAHSRKSAIEIAAATGFNSAGALARAYRIRYGEPPIETRRRSRAGEGV